MEINKIYNEQSSASPLPPYYTRLFTFIPRNSPSFHPLRQQSSSTTVRSLSTL